MSTQSGEPPQSTVTESGQNDAPSKPPATSGVGGTEECSNDTPEPVPLERRIVTVNGEQFFEFPRTGVSAEEHLNNLRSMPMRENDVIIAAYAKSGTHWLWEVVQMLLSGKVEYETRTKEFLMMEFAHTDEFKTLPSPRILNAHLHLRYLSKEIETKQPHVLHVLRNPKDIAVSHYYHNRQREHEEDKGVLDFIEKFLDGGKLPGACEDYFAYLPEMEKWEKEHPDVPFLTICFEDMKEFPVESVKQLAQFLGLALSDSFCADVADACSFAKLKKADETREPPVHKFKPNRPKMQMYRKGEVGDWKNHFTVALSERLDAVVAEKLKDCIYASKFRYSL